MYAFFLDGGRTHVLCSVSLPDLWSVPGGITSIDTQPVFFASTPKPRIKKYVEKSNYHDTLRRSSPGFHNTYAYFSPPGRASSATALDTSHEVKLVLLWEPQCTFSYRGEGYSLPRRLFCIYKQIVFSNYRQPKTLLSHYTEGVSIEALLGLSWEDASWTAAI